MPGERSRDLERLITFVDAIVAIAITLLVLPLAELAGQLHDNESVAHLLHQHGNELWSFFISFGVITRLWFVQHRMVRDVDHLGPLAMAALMAWTLTVVFLPFPTALLGPTGSQALTKLLYIGSLTVGTACLAVLAHALGRPPTHASAPPRVAPAVSTLGVLVFALVLTLLVPAVSYYPLLLLAADGRLVDAWDRLAARRRRPGTEAGLTTGRRRP